MVAHQNLDLRIGVRIPAPEPKVRFRLGRNGSILVPDPNWVRFALAKGSSLLGSQVKI